MTPESIPGLSIRAADVEDAVQRIRIALFERSPVAPPSAVAKRDGHPSAPPRDEREDARAALRDAA